jgi:hypothetical protein
MDGHLLWSGIDDPSASICRIALADDTDDPVSARGIVERDIARRAPRTVAATFEGTGAVISETAMVIGGRGRGYGAAEEHKYECRDGHTKTPIPGGTGVVLHGAVPSVQLATR